MRKVTHIAQNIAERCQEYFPYFVAIEILSNITKYFIAALQFQFSEIFLETNKYLTLLKVL